jgi:hypothetical protein
MDKREVKIKFKEDGKIKQKTIYIELPVEGIARTISIKKTYGNN